MLEYRPEVGGGVKTEEVTLPGFKHDTCSTAHGGIQANPVMRNDELHLIRDYGIEYIQADPIYHMPFPDGSYITQWRDLDRTCEEFAKFSKKDAAAYRRMHDENEAAKSIFEGNRFNAARLWRKVGHRTTGRASAGKILAAPPGHVPVGSAPRQF